MAETITRTDLTNILKEVLPPTPSEYKKLLWTNPSPTTQFAEQTISLDLSNYDAVEVVYKLYINQQYDVTGQITYQSSQSVTVSASGTGGFFSGADAPMARTASMTSSGVHFSAGSLASGTGSWTTHNQCLIPYKIYGIKYERVNPPQAEIADYVVEQGTSGIWTYRKWNSGIAECWAVETVHPSMTTPYGSSYIANLGDRSFPTGLFITVPKLSIDLVTAGGVGGACASNISATTITVVYAYNFTMYDASARDLHLSFDAKGRWR